MIFAFLGPFNAGCIFIGHVKTIDAFGIKPFSHYKTTYNKRAIFCRCPDVEDVEEREESVGHLLKQVFVLEMVPIWRSSYGWKRWRPLDWWI